MLVIKNAGLLPVFNEIFIGGLTNEKAIDCDLGIFCTQHDFCPDHIPGIRRYVEKTCMRQWRRVLGKEKQQERVALQEAHED